MCVREFVFVVFRFLFTALVMKINMCLHEVTIQACPRGWTGMKCLARRITACLRLPVVL